MFATTSELKSSAGTGLVVRIYEIGITLATGHFDEIALDLDLEGILLQFNKRATTLIDSDGLLEILNSTCTPGNICNHLATI